MTAAAYIFWCGLVWVLRGGLFGAAVRRFWREPGTTITRIVCAGLMAAPLAFVIGPWALALWASIYVAMTIGYFDESMGLEQPGRDHAFLALWGIGVAAIAIAPLWGRISFFSDPLSVVAFGDLYALSFALLGGLAVAAYAVNKPFGRRLGTDWTERAEFLTGCAMGAAIWCAA
ncbi:MAG: hypothetical protein ING29_00975 [Azospirillum sp.]|nr:hypothetical protein [Azospirillum sp.]